jgi:hypothetical protein
VSHQVVGTSPFLKGLRHLLEQQTRHPCALQWTLAISLFTESGGTEFLSDALSLMLELQFRPLVLTHQDGTTCFVEVLNSD